MACMEGIQPSRPLMANRYYRDSKEKEEHSWRHKHPQGHTANH